MTQPNLGERQNEPRTLRRRIHFSEVWEQVIKAGQKELLGFPESALRFLNCCSAKERLGRGVRLLCRGTKRPNPLPLHVPPEVPAETARAQVSRG